MCTGKKSGVEAGPHHRRFQEPRKWSQKRRQRVRIETIAHNKKKKKGRKKGRHWREWGECGSKQTTSKAKHVGIGGEAGLTRIFDL